ncbi:MAG TPA: hypothetical protein VEA80_14295 [Vitreimonas sp.]|uniref:hypothetical protein n=1 Tax=Vitreimonas sp. TaxID=3069702 RepID=UPI002D2638BC|nr:hypothetical protein [Vitreimonas sp.]HYD88641.1 hypothetical protein [Vitreimonas sp.]
MTEAQAAATRYCARLIGPLMLIIGAIVIARFDDLTLLMPAILEDGPLAFVTGIFTLICGCALFAGHHHWTSATAIVISLLGLLTIVRGVTLMLAPDLLAEFALQFVNAGPGVIAAGAMALLIGAWLAFVGWFAKGWREV